MRGTILFGWVLVGCGGTTPESEGARRAERAVHESVAQPVPEVAPVVAPQPSAAPEPPARPLVAEGEALPILAAGHRYTCVLFPERLTCFGAVPGSTGGEPSSTHALHADLLFAGDDIYCAAARGSRELRCFGATPSESMETAWERRCGDEEGCFAARERAYEAEGLPLPAPGPIRDLAGFENRICALAGDQLACWDFEAEEPARSRRSTRVRRARDVEAGVGMLCVRGEAGAVSCREDFGGWDAPEPLRPVEYLPAVARIAVAGSFACGWEESGVAHCWGAVFPLDIDIALEETSATAVPMLDHASALSANESMSGVFCAAYADRISCWSENRGGGAEQSHVAIEGAEQLSVGREHACAIDAGRVLCCWGRADSGALGLARRRRDFAPIEVAGVRAEALSLHGNRSCVRTAGGWTCWGRLTQDGAREPWRARNVGASDAMPTEFYGLDCRLAQGTLRCRRGENDEAQPARAHIDRCIVRPSGALACGRSLGALHDVAGASGVTLIAGSPLRVAAYSGGAEITLFRVEHDGVARERAIAVRDTVVDMALDRGSLCFVQSGGSVSCARTYGGDARPLEIAPGAVVEDLVADGNHFCARTRAGAVYCWGGAHCRARSRRPAHPHGAASRSGDRGGRPSHLRENVRRPRVLLGRRRRRPARSSSLVVGRRARRRRRPRVIAGSRTASARRAQHRPPAPDC